MAEQINRSVSIYLNEQDVAKSIENMSKKAAALTAQMEKAASPEEWNKLNTELQQTNGKINTLGRQMSGELAPSMNQLTKTASQLRREIGNLAPGTQAFIDKTKQLQQVNAKLAETKSQVNGVQGALQKAGGALGDMAGQLPGIGQAFTALRAIATTAFGPIGIILGVIVGLLSQNADLVDELSFAFEGLKKVTRVLGDALYELIGEGFNKLKIAISDPKQAIIDFGNAIKDNLINRIKGLQMFMEAAQLAMEGKWAEAALKAKDAALQYATGIDKAGEKLDAFGKKLSDAYQEGNDAARAMDGNAVAVARLENAIAKATVSIAAYETVMKNTNETDEARLNAATRIIELEEANAARRLQIIDLEIKALEEKNKGVRLNGEEEAKMINLQTQRLQVAAQLRDNIRKAEINRDTLTAEIQKRIAEQAIKNAEEQDKGILATIKQTVRSIQLETENFSKKAFDAATFFLLRIGAKRRQAALDQDAEEKQRREKFINDTYFAIDAAQQLFSNVMQGVNMMAQADLEAARISADEQKNALDERLAKGLISEEEYRKKVAKIDERYKEKERQMKRQQFIRDKAANMVQAIINTAVAVSKVIANPFQAALTAALGAAQVAMIAAQPIPTFFQGGPTGRAKNRQMRDQHGPIAGLVHEDEWVGPKWMNEHPVYGSVIDRLEEARKLGRNSLHPAFNFAKMQEAIQAVKYPQLAGLMAGSFSDENMVRTIKQGHKLQVQSSKYIVNGIVEGISHTAYAKGRRI